MFLLKRFIVGFSIRILSSSLSSFCSRLLRRQPWCLEAKILM